MPNFEHLPDQLLPLLCVASILLTFVLPMWTYITLVERKVTAARQKAIAAGRHEPVTIQPFVDQSVCMGSGACVPACPEDVLGVIEGQAVAINMSACIGHGACVTACPVGAIELVFGSEKRGIDIPRVGPNFETNVPGIFIAGELGGMGLIAHAAEQGVKALEGAAAGLSKVGDLIDVAIVGAGPAGLGAAAAAKANKISYVLLDQDDFGGAVRHYPRKKLVFTRPLTIPGYGRVQLRTLTKEELVDLFRDVITRLGIEVSANERVDRIEKVGNAFSLTTTKRTVQAQRVILALGRRGTPRKLDVPGEEQEKVAYSLLEPEHYQHDHLLVVGGGDSAVEAALQLSEQEGNKVSLSYRGDAINRPKEKNIHRLEDAVKDGLISLYLGSEISQIGSDRVHLTYKSESMVLPNDHVFVMVGGVLPTKFLQSAGIAIDKHYGKRVESEAKEAKEPKPAKKTEEPTLFLGPTEQFDEVPIGLDLATLASEPTAVRVRPMGNDEPTIALEPPETPEAPEAPANEEVLFDTEISVSLARRLPPGPLAALLHSLSVAKTAGEPERIARAQLALAYGLLDCGRDDESQRALDASRLGWTTPSADAFLQMRLQAKLCARSGQQQPSLHWWDCASALALQYDSPPDQALACAGYAELALLRGEISAAREHLSRAGSLLSARSPIDVVAETATLRVELERALGRWNEARTHAQGFCDLAAKRADPEMIAASRALLAEVFALGGRPDAVAMAREAIDSVRRQKQQVDAVLLRAMRVVCDLGGELPSWLDSADPPPPDPILDHESAMVVLLARARAKADSGSARTKAYYILDHLRASSPLAAFRICLDAAIALRDAGDQSGARAALSRATSTLSALDAPLPGLIREAARVEASLKAEALTAGGRRALHS